MKKNVIVFLGVLLLFAVAVYAASEATSMRDCIKDCRESKSQQRKLCAQEYKDSRSECRDAYRSCYTTAKDEYKLYQSSSDTAVNRENYLANKRACRDTYKTCFKEAISIKKACYQQVKDDDLQCKSSEKC